MSDLLSSLSSLSTLSSSSTSGWVYASVIIGACGAVGLWIFLTFFAKGREKRNVSEDVKNFFTVKGGFAEDLAKIVYFYMSIKTLIASFELLSSPSNGFWLFLTTAVGQLIWYRFVYEVIIAVIKKK